MDIRVHPHAAARMQERGATLEAVIATVESGERFAAKFNRTGFRRNFLFNRERGGRRYATKQLEVPSVPIMMRHLRLKPSDRAAVLTGKSKDGVPVFGVDSVLVPSVSLSKR